MIEEHWDKLLFVGTIILFFFAWRWESGRAAEKALERDEQIISALTELTELVRDGQKDRANEHRGLSDHMDVLEARSAERHAKLLEKTERLITSVTSMDRALTHHIQHDIAKKEPL